MTENISRPHLSSNTTGFLAEQFSASLSDSDLLRGFQVDLASGDALGKDRILQADYLLAFDKVKKTGQWREATVEYGIFADIRDKCPEMQQIMVKEYGRDWHTRAPENVVEQAWRLTEKIRAREVHGSQVNDTLRDYWENPRFSKEGGERIYLPEGQHERREILAKAQYYNNARIDTRVRMLDVVDEIVVAKDMGYTSSEAQLLRKRLTHTWEQEEITRAEYCVYEVDEEVQSLKLTPLAEKNETEVMEEVTMIAEKIRSVSNVMDEDRLLSNVGIGINANDTYHLNWTDSEHGSTLLVKGRLGQRELMPTYVKCLEKIGSGSENDADIALMNAIGMQSMATIESAGRETVIAEIYEQRGYELVDDVDADIDTVKRKMANKKVEDESKSEKHQYTYEMMKHANEIIYKAAAAVTNSIRMNIIQSGSYFRKTGEKMADWVDKISSWASPRIDRYLSSKLQGDRIDFSDSSGTVQRGRVNLALDNIKN